MTGMPERDYAVIVADDHPIVLRGLSGVLDAQPGYRVVGTAGTAAETLDRVQALRPEILVLDLRLGTSLAPDLIPRLLSKHPDLMIVVLTAHDDGALLNRCIAAGARAVVLKGATEDDLLGALSVVVRGGRHVDPRLAAERSFRECGIAQAGGFETLSSREYDILLLLGRGFDTREMAEELKLRPNTVRSYVQTVLGKLQSKNRIMALAKAKQLGLL